MIATRADIPRIVDVGRSFHAASHWSDVKFDAPTTEAFLSELMGRGAVFIGRGILGVAIQPLYFNPAHRLCVEVFFWGLGGGRSLLQEAETWAKDQGCGFFHVAASEDRASSFFRRAGYAPFGLQFRKVL